MSGESTGDRQARMAEMRPMLLLAFTVFIDLLGFGIVIPNLPQYIEQCVGHGLQDHAHAAVIGTLLAASYSVAQFIFAPIWGRISDNHGRRPIILLSLLGVGASYILFGVSNGHLWMLFAARLLAGVLSSASIGVAFAYVADITSPEKRAGRIGMLGACIGMGFVFGPFIGGQLGHINLSLPAYVAAAMALLNFAFTVVALPESHKKDARDAQRAMAPNHSPLVLMTKVVSGPAGFLFLLTFITTFGFAAMEQIFSYYLLRVFPDQVNSANQPQVTGNILGIAGVLSGVIQGGVVRRLVGKERFLILVGLALMVVGFATFPIPRHVYALAFGPMILLFAGRAALAPGLSALISSKANLGQGLTLSTSQSFDSLARACGPIIAGMLFQYLSPAAPYYLSACVMAVAFTFAYSMRSRMTVASASPSVKAEEKTVAYELETDANLTEAH